MHYMAWRIGEGAVPYRDLFDMNFPGVYLLHLLVVAHAGRRAIWRGGCSIWPGSRRGAVAAAAFAAPWGRLAAPAPRRSLIALYHLAGGAWQAGPA